MAGGSASGFAFQSVTGVSIARFADIEVPEERLISGVAEIENPAASHDETFSRSRPSRGLRSAIAPYRLVVQRPAVARVFARGDFLGASTETVMR